MLYPLSYRGPENPWMIRHWMNPTGIGLVFLGAGAGGVARHLLNLALHPLARAIPLGTLVANVAGSFLAGALVALLALRVELDPGVRLLLLTGFLGGLTTFSTFAVEIAAMLQDQRWSTAAAAIGLHVVGSLAAALLGMAAMRTLLPARVPL